MPTVRQPMIDVVRRAGRQQQVGHTEHWSIGGEVLLVEPRSLHAHDRQDVAPLTVGGFSALAIPAELLQQDVFRRMHVNRAAAHRDRLTTRQLLRIQGRVAGDEQVDLQLRGVVDEISYSSGRGWLAARPDRRCRSRRRAQPPVRARRRRSTPLRCRYRPSNAALRRTSWRSSLRYCAQRRSSRALAPPAARGRSGRPARSPQVHPVYLRVRAPRQVPTERDDGQTEEVSARCGPWMTRPDAARARS
jgi:hypothetical protein